MSERLLLLVVVLVSYFAAHVLFDRLARRFALVSGAEYLAIGLVLGPSVAGVLQPQVVESFNPLITLGFGWIGALAGTQLALPRLVRTPAVRYRVALAETIVAGLCIGLVQYAVLRWVTGMRETQAGFVAAALALLALPASAAGVRIAAGTQSSRDPVVRQLEVATVLQGVIASGGIAVLFATLHPTPTGIGRPLVPTEWVAITLAIGIAGGTLFHLFVGDETKVDRLFISLAGTIILVSGAAAALRLSPVFAAVVFGAILGNTRGNRAEIIAALRRVERPFYFALLVFAGASWQPGQGAWLLPFAVFVVLRPVARLAAARLGARLNGMLVELGPQWGRGLIGHGGFALVLAFDYLRQGQAPNGNLVFSAVVASLLLTEVLSARFIQSVLRLPALLTMGAPDESADRADAGAGSSTANAPERGA